MFLIGLRLELAEEVNRSPRELCQFLSLKDSVCIGGQLVDDTVDVPHQPRVQLPGMVTDEENELIPLATNALQIVQRYGVMASWLWLRRACADWLASS